MRLAANVGTKALGIERRMVVFVYAKARISDGSEFGRRTAGMLRDVTIDATRSGGGGGGGWGFAMVGASMGGT